MVIFSANVSLLKQHTKKINKWTIDNVVSNEIICLLLWLIFEITHYFDSICNSLCWSCHYRKNIIPSFGGVIARIYIKWVDGWTAWKRARIIYFFYHFLHQRTWGPWSRNRKALTFRLSRYLAREVNQFRYHRTPRNRIALKFIVLSTKRDTMIVEGSCFKILNI